MTPDDSRPITASGLFEPNTNRTTFGLRWDVLASRRHVPA